MMKRCLSPVLCGSCSLAAVVLALSGRAAGQDDEWKLEVLEGWSTCFDAKEATYHVMVRAPEKGRARLAWSFAVETGIVKRGETALDLRPDAVTEVEIRLPVPEIREGLVVPAQLSAQLQLEGRQAAQATVVRQLWVFTTNPFAHQSEWLKGLAIALFDPEGQTIRTFRDLEIPFREIDDVDAISQIHGGVLVVGEGVSFREYRGLPELLVRAAASGASVLCLAPREGTVMLPGAGDSILPKPERIMFRRTDVITALDKRLDSAAWPPDGRVVASSASVSGEGRELAGEIVRNDAGWPWVEVHYPGARSTLVLCGFGVIEKWDAGPTPRYLLARTLEYLWQGDERERGDAIGRGDDLGREANAARAQPMRMCRLSLGFAG